MRFIHAADIHLGRQFYGLTRSSPELGQLFLQAGYSAWNNIIDHAVKHKADFLTLGGDIFDASNASLRPRVAFRQGLERLRDAGIPVYAVLGNHDPLQTFPESLRSLPGLILFGADPEQKEIVPGAVIYGASFPVPAVKENLVAAIRRDPGQELAVGLLHTNVSGASDHDDYAPCSPGDLRASGMDMWCLGHVHTPTTVMENPLVLYSGSSQGAHRNESGPRGCFLIDLERGHIETEFLPTAAVRWEYLNVDVSDCSNPEDVLEAIEQGCSALVSDRNTLEALVAEIRFVGSIPQLNIQGLLQDEEFRYVVRERVSALPVPAFPSRFVDNTYSQADSLTRADGLPRDLQNQAKRILDDPEETRKFVHQIRNELVKVNQEYYRDLLHPERWNQHPEVASEFMNQAVALVLTMISETAD
ncbi:metallophosphoesterase family protein [Desulfomonile tiedjei]|uniref:DNA repair exonuclease n=1 Tax=Desulfomonile tiedjei (strain ATCC 49306 / DSM 6799 / DCB-1) TaxID=706587 RepID=I4C661_DESTA|nr:DNA repair exonuclease [Desulfomonile tiedjei]AFM25052.1 DNA repair exonuclease [Desulfomonile tiedjei DSM 6799]